MMLPSGCGLRGSIYESLLLPVDKLHLTSEGMTRLMKNLKVSNLTKVNVPRYQKNPLPPKMTEIATKQESLSIQAQNNNRHTKSRNGTTVFYGRHSVFSNLNTDAPITVDGRTYCCNEQLFGYSKAKYFDDENQAELILNCDNPHEIVKLHKDIKGYNEQKWRKEGEKVLYLANMAKYSQNTKARESLLATGSGHIGEASMSKLWGIGLQLQDSRSSDHTQWNGQNLMGNILMRVRRSLLKSESRPDTVEEIYEEISPQRQAPYPRSYAQPSYSPIPSQTYPRRSSPHSQNQSSRSNSPNYPESYRQPPRQYATRSQQPVCYNCGESGHLTHSCKWESPIRCWTCQRLGHKAKLCDFSSYAY